MNLRVMTFNLLTSTKQKRRHPWRLRRRNIARIFREWQPDVVGTQEANFRQLKELSDHPPTDPHPQVLSTNRHLFQGSSCEKIIAAQPIEYLTGATRKSAVDGVGLTVIFLTNPTRKPFSVFADDLDRAAYFGRYFE